MCRFWSKATACMASALLALAVSVMPTPRASVAAVPVQQITFWHFMSGGAGVRLVDLINSFNRSHPTIHVNALLITWGVPFYTKLQTSAVANRAPDLITMHESRLPYFAAKGVLDPFPSSELTAQGLTEKVFYSKLWAGGQYNNAQYGVPLDTHPQVLYYNTKLAKQAGLLAADGRLKPIASEAQFLQACRQIKQKTGKYCVAFLNNDPVGIWRTWYALYKQQNGEVLADHGHKVVLDATKATRALTFMVNLVKAGYAARNEDYPTMIALFGSEKAAFEINGAWEVPTYQGKLSYDMALFPQIFDNAATWADAHAFSIPHHRAPMDAQKRAAILTFISYVEKNVLVWAKGGLAPAYIPVANSPAYREFVPLSHTIGESRYVTYDPAASYTGAASPVESDASQALVGAFTGQLTPAAAVQKFVAQLNQLAGKSGGDNF